jgi:hypothetical protein
MIYRVYDSLLLCGVAYVGYVIWRNSTLPFTLGVLALIGGVGLVMNLVPRHDIGIIVQISIAMLIGALVSEVLPKKAKIKDGERDSGP